MTGFLKAGSGERGGAKAHFPAKHLVGIWNGGVKLGQRFPTPSAGIKSVPHHRPASPCPFTWLLRCYGRVCFMNIVPTFQSFFPLIFCNNKDRFNNRKDTCDTAPTTVILAVVLSIALPLPRRRERGLFTCVSCGHKLLSVVCGCRRETILYSTFLVQKEW